LTSSSLDPFIYHLSTNALQALDQIHDALLQTSKLDTKNIHRPAIIELVETCSGIVTSLDILRGQLLLQSGEVFADELTDLLVAEVASRDEEALAGCLGELDGLHVRKSHVADVDPEVGSRLGDLLLALALDQVTDSLVGGVERIERVEVVDDWAQD